MKLVGFGIIILLVVLVILSIINVVLQTKRALATGEWGAWATAILGAIIFTLYTVIVIYQSTKGLGFYMEGFYY